MQRAATIADITLAVTLDWLVGSMQWKFQKIEDIGYRPRHVGPQCPRCGNHLPEQRGLPFHGFFPEWDDRDMVPGRL